MFNLDIKKYVAQAVNSSVEHAPELLTDCTIVGFVTTVALVAKGAPTVKDILDSEREYEEDPEVTEEEITESRKETAKELLPYVIPPLITSGLTIACAIGSNRISNKRMAALTAAYKVSETTLMEYRNKFQQDLLEASKDVTEASKKPKRGKKAKTEEPEQSKHAELDDAKTYRMVLLGTGQEFHSTMQEIRAICGDINTRAISEMTVSINEFADMVDIPHIKHGDKIGWDAMNNKAELIGFWPDYDPKTDELYVRVDLNDGLLYGNRRW
jgi:hypothetical protein